MKRKIRVGDSYSTQPMTDAPWISTFIAIALIPVAILFTHAYISGRKNLPYHRWTGMIGILWDLTLSIFYMAYRSFGGEIEGSKLNIEGLMIAYFVIHGIIAIVVIGLEITMLITGAYSRRKIEFNALHIKLSPYLYIVWFMAFLSGEAVYVGYYLL
ncbi:MAG: hypothetical protein KKE24_00185 [Candidatus Thermoplasmatota archaeon]|nr:hypothetical protein [Candidatus Thermoplasmatota archaeon]